LACVELLKNIFDQKGFFIDFKPLLVIFFCNNMFGVNWPAVNIPAVNWPAMNCPAVNCLCKIVCGELLVNPKITKNINF
jgi:hypothetical protein